jgi:enamine deaminase RidA (YjgF/YER057c/UK114 family)
MAVPDPDLPPLTVSETAGRLRVSTGAPWEAKVGYSRAVRVGNQVFVTGTVGRLQDGRYPPIAGEQARQALRIIEAALRAAGARLEHVVRTRMFVTDISRWQEIGAAHAEFFAAIRPATTMVEVARLIDAEAVVEIEADAVVP